MAHCYYATSLAGLDVGDSVELDGAEAKHAVAVSRARVGEQIVIGDGAGHLADGVFASTNPVSITISNWRNVVEHTPKIALAQALAKGDRDERAIQAATELGVDVIVPWQAARSIVTWRGDKVEKHLERWRTIVREASKQALRAWVPVVTEPVTTAQLAAMSGDWRIIVLEPTATLPLTGIEYDGRNVLLVVGPEGGVAPEELAKFETAELARLGDTVLRTSTAGPAAISVLAARFGRWA